MTEPFEPADPVPPGHGESDLIDDEDDDIDRYEDEEDDEQAG